MLPDDDDAVTQPLDFHALEELGPADLLVNRDEL